MRHVNRPSILANPILRRWDAVCATHQNDPAILSSQGEVLRTFSEVEEGSLRWTNQLAGQAPTGVMALQAGNDAEWPSILLAAWRLGFAVALLDPEVTGERRARIETLCGVSLRVEKFADEWKLLRMENPGPAWGECFPDLLKLTSGTTADARVVRFTADQLLADCETVCDTMGIGPGDINYGAIAFAHSYGFSNLITPLICRGVALVATGDLMPRALLEGLAKSRATVFPAVPALFRALAGFRPGKMELRLCISAGARLDTEVSREFYVSYGRKVHSFYGASECGGICYDGGDDPVPPPGYVGPPMQNVQIQPTAESGSSLVTVSSAAVGLGYHPTGERDSLLGGAFQPADLLEWTGSGYVIRGRISDTINVAGRKVNPCEVERVVMLCQGVREVVVLGLHSEARGEEVAACVVGDISEEKLKVHCANTLPAWQLPRRWMILDTLPVNARGKTSREILRELFQS